jgi:hypothetical protein
VKATCSFETSVCVCLFIARYSFASRIGCTGGLAVFDQEILPLVFITYMYLLYFFVFIALFLYFCNVFTVSQRKKISFVPSSKLILVSVCSALHHCHPYQTYPVDICSLKCLATNLRKPTRNKWITPATGQVPRGQSALTGLASAHWALLSGFQLLSSSEYEHLFLRPNYLDERQHALHKGYPSIPCQVGTISILFRTWFTH